MESAGGITLTIAGPSPSCNKPPGDHTVMEQSPQVLCLASLPRGDDPTPSPSEKQNSAQKFEQKVSLSGVRLDSHPKPFEGGRSDMEGEAKKQRWDHA